MNDPAFYRAVEEADQSCGHMTATVMDGIFFGKKALLSEQGTIWQIAWQTKPGGWADRYYAPLTKIAKTNKTGIYRIDGNRVFCEFLRGEKKLVVCGGGHVSIPIIRLGRMIGCHVTVLEDRPEFADRAKKAGASRVICEPFAQGLEQVDGDLDTFFVVVTRGHRYDQICLESIANKEHAYIGLMGSRKRTSIVKQTLIERGCRADVINSIHTPIGLDIGARTPEEIAVAVIAEIIQVKNRLPDSAFPREIMDALRKAKDAQEPMVLATIVARSGSAPREVGTKMLIRADGSCTGTIGGGSAEARIQKRALLLMQAGEAQTEVYQADLSGKDAEEEGMVCGGVIDVLLEMIKAGQ